MKDLIIERNGTAFHLTFTDDELVIEYETMKGRNYRLEFDKIYNRYGELCFVSRTSESSYFIGVHWDNILNCFSSRRSGCVYGEYIDCWDLPNDFFDLTTNK